jgi:hypothetical protein
MDQGQERASATSRARVHTSPLYHGRAWESAPDLGLRRHPRAPLDAASAGGAARHAACTRTRVVVLSPPCTHAEGRRRTPS